MLGRAACFLHSALELDKKIKLNLKKREKKKATLDSLKIYNTAPKPTKSLVMFFEVLRYTTATNVHS